MLYQYHTVIPLWIYRIPSELRSQAGLGLPSTVVGDHTGIVGAVCFLCLFVLVCFAVKNKSGESGFRSRCLVVANDALYRLS